MIGDSAETRALRLRMVREQIGARGVDDAATLAALRAVPRHLFLPEAVRDLAYDDRAVSIGEGQTISQPYIVAMMTALIRPDPQMRVLEIGTGSGYQTAVLARCVAEVDTIENHPNLAHAAEAILLALGIDNVRVHVGDGFDGLPDRAPFDAIVMTAAPAEVPGPLLDQLKVGGRLVGPVGLKGAKQELVVVTKTADGTTTKTVGSVLFVPMTGKAEERP